MDESSLNRVEPARPPVASTDALTLLANGLSHELNNLLTLYLGHLAILRGEISATSAGDASHQALAQATDSLTFISSCLRQLAASRVHLTDVGAEAEVRSMLEKIHRLRDHPPTRGEPAAVPPPGIGRRALVCVAEPQIRRLIVTALREHGLEVCGESQFAQLEVFLRSPQNAGQIAILDFDGLDSLERLRFFDLLSLAERLLMVVTTGQPEVESAIAAHSSCRILKKPFKVGTLLECLD